MSCRWAPVNADQHGRDVGTEHGGGLILASLDLHRPSMCHSELAPRFTGALRRCGALRRIQR